MAALVSQVSKACQDFQANVALKVIKETKEMVEHQDPGVSQDYQGQKVNVENVVCVDQLVQPVRKESVDHLVPQDYQDLMALQESKEVQVIVVPKDHKVSRVTPETQVYQANQAFKGSGVYREKLEVQEDREAPVNGEFPVRTENQANKVHKVYKDCRDQ